MEKQFLTYSKLNEALKLSQYRKYHGKRLKEIEKELDVIFQGKNRIYLPFEYKVKDDDINKIKDIVKVLQNNGYTVTNYLEGYCEKDGRTFRIGKVLNKLGYENLLKTFNEDPNRAVQNKNFLICISKHPYDIAGMSTDRGWTSCMNLEDGINKSFVLEEIKEGTIIAYLIDEKDKNINHPYGRINIKPYIKENEEEMVWGLANYCYGSLLHDKAEEKSFSNLFKKEINKWLDNTLNYKKIGKYNIVKSIYQEAEDSLERLDPNSIQYKLLKWKIRLEYYDVHTKTYNNSIIVKDFEGETFTSFMVDIELDIEKAKYLYFENCFNLKNILKLPENLSGLYFKNCPVLENVNYPKTVDGELRIDKSCKKIYSKNITEIRKSNNINPIYYEWETNSVNTINMPSFIDSNEKLLEVLNSPENKHWKGLHLYNVPGFETLRGIPNNIETLVLVSVENLKSLEDLPKNMKYLEIIQCQNLKSIKRFPVNLYRLTLDQLPELSELTNTPKFIKDITLSNLDALERKIKNSNAREIFQNRDFYYYYNVEPKYKTCNISIYDVENGYDETNKTLSVGTRTVSPPTILKHFKDLQTHTGLDIKHLKGKLSFRRNISSIETLPETIDGDLDLYNCINLKEIKQLPKKVTGRINAENCPFFEGMNEIQIREKYNILPLINKNVIEWGIDIQSYLSGTYYKNLSIPDHITEFKGFEEHLDLPINYLEYSLSFYGCKELTAVSNLPTKIGSYLSFQGCEKLVSVKDIPDKLLGSLNFMGCENLEYIEKLPNLSLSGNLNFTDCKKIKRLPKLPELVDGNIVFSSCENLEHIEKMPSVVKGSIYTKNCPFFENLTELQIREKYNISSE